jgi:DNA-binding protein HU-beta
MNKSELIDTVAKQTGQTKAAVAAIVNATLDTVQAAVAAGDRMEVKGFGVFERRFREGGERRNPQGGTVQVAAKHVPSFKAGAGFKQAVNSAA